MGFLCRLSSIKTMAIVSAGAGHVGWPGPKDSTAVLGTKTGNAWEGVALTRDHKPNLKDEKQSAWDCWATAGQFAYVWMVRHTFNGKISTEALGVIRRLNP
jgi:hypothetical protein